MNEETHSKSKPRKRKKVWKILLVVLALLIIIRLMLPYFVLKYVNKQLAEMDGYYGHVEDIDLHLYRGAYVIKDIKILKIEDKKTKNDTIPFFKSKTIDLSIEWKSLFKGRIVSELSFNTPVINFVNERKMDVKADTADFRKLIKSLMPITINHFEVRLGEIHYIDPYSSPKIDVYMDNITVVAKNLSNVTDKNELLPASITATGTVYEGKFNLAVKMDALQKQPTFDLNAELISVDMVRFNDMMQAYGNFDVKKGNFGLYTEFAAKNGEFGGYVKPIIKDLDVVQWTKEEGNFKQILWETIVATGAEVFQNQKQEQLASKIEIKGRFDNPDINVVRAISFVLRNAFLGALKPAIEETININKLEEGGKKTFLEKIFGSKDDKEGDNDKNHSKKKK